MFYKGEPWQIEIFKIPDAINKLLVFISLNFKSFIKQPGGAPHV